MSGVQSWSYRTTISALKHLIQSGDSFNTSSISTETQESLKSGGEAERCLEPAGQQQQRLETQTFLDLCFEENAA